MVTKENHFAAYCLAVRVLFKRQIHFLFRIQYHKDFEVSKQKFDCYGHQFYPKELLDSENGSVYTIYMYHNLLRLVFYLEMYWKTMKSVIEEVFDDMFSIKKTNCSVSCKWSENKEFSIKSGAHLFVQKAAFWKNMQVRVTNGESLRFFFEGKNILLADTEVLVNVENNQADL